LEGLETFLSCAPNALIVEAAEMPEPVSVPAVPVRALLGRLGPVFDHLYLCSRAARTRDEVELLGRTALELRLDSAATREYSANLRAQSSAARAEAVKARDLVALKT
jgi:hypothetical protein